MTSTAMFALVLYIVGMAGVFVQSGGYSPGGVSLGWLGVGLGMLAYLLTEFPG